MTDRMSSADTANIPENIETGDDWQRLSLIAIIYFTVRNIAATAQGFIYVIPALAITFNTLDDVNSPVAYIGISVVILMASLSGVVSFLMYKFRVHNLHIEIHNGVFQRRYINLPFWRIQNVKIERPFYYRPFGYALVVLDTAGSGTEEANIVAVPLFYAHALRKRVLLENAHDAAVQNGSDNKSRVSSGSLTLSDKSSDAKDAQEEVLNTRSVGDIVIHGITNNRIWIVLGAAAPFYDDVFGYVSNWLAEKGLQLNQLVGEQAIAWWQFSLYAFVLLMMMMAVMALLSVGGALFTFYGYTLSRVDDRYIRRSGLLNKLEVSMRASRIQMITAKQDWLDKILKRVNLYFEQNTSVSQQAQELMSPNKLIVPSVTVEEALALSQEVMPGCHLHKQDYQTISKRFIFHWLLMVWSIPLGVALTIGLVGDHTDIVIFSLSLFCAIGMLLTLRWWRWGVTFDSRFIYVRRGRIGVDYLCFEPYKVQQVVVKQSVFMKKRKLATIKFVLASGAVTIPFLPEYYVHHLANSVLYEVESTKRSWM